MVVVAIVATATVGAGLALRSADSSSRLISAGEELASLLETLSAQAAVQRTPLMIGFVPGQSKIELLSFDGDKEDIWAHHLSNCVIVEQVELNHQAQPGGPVELMVQPSGYIQDTTIRLGLENKRLSVTWQGHTGRCEIGVIEEADHGNEWSYE